MANDIDTLLPCARFEYEREEIDRRECGWLERKGWTYTSQTPCCRWMFVREWEGKTIIVDQDTARMFQGKWDADEDYHLHPERYED